MAGGCKVTSQMVMLFLGIIFWGAAAGFLYMGTWVIQTYGNFHHAEDILKQTYTTVPAVISICIGVFMFIVGIMSCCGAFQKNRCFLATFFVLLLLIATFLVAAGVLGYVYKGEVESGVRDQMNKTMQEYTGTNTTIDTEVDWLQKEFSCCGLTNATDWATFPWGLNHTGKAPVSCCAKDAKNCTGDLNDKNLNNKGCFAYVRDSFENNLKYIALSATAGAVIMIVGMISACVLFWQKRDQLPYVNLTSSGYTV